MSILWKGRDYAADEGGGVAAVSGGAAVLNDVLFRLTARRGSFPLLPGLGSRMYLLREAKASERTVLARQYAVEALAELGDITVTDAVVTAEGEDLRVRVELTWEGRELAVELEG